MMDLNEVWHFRFIEHIIAVKVVQDIIIDANDLQPLSRFDL